MAICSNRGFGGRRSILVFAAALTLFAAACAGADESRRMAAPGVEMPTPTPGASPTAAAAAAPLPAPTSVGDALRAAGEALHGGRYDAAAVAYAAIAIAAHGAARAEALIGLAVARSQDGQQSSAIDALRAGVAAAPPDSVEALRAGYLLGVRLNEAHASHEAAAVLRQVMTSTRGIPLAPYVASEYARAVAAAGDQEAATAAWDVLLADPSTPRALRAEVLRKRIEAAREAGDAAGLARWLDQKISTDGESSTIYERAQLAVKAGDTATSIALLQQLVSNHPASREALSAVADLRDLGAAIDAGQEGLIYYRRGAYRDARRVLSAALKETGMPPAALAFRLYFLAASYEDAGMAAEAVDYYDQAAAVQTASPYIHRAKYWAARITESDGHAKEAARRYALMVKDGPAGEFTEEAAFRAGYTLLASGDAAAAVDMWEMAGASPGPRVAYWKARAFQQVGRRFEAQGQLAHVIELDPLSFYGLQAATELGRATALDVSYRKRDLTAAVDWRAIEAWVAARQPGALSGSPATPAADFMAVGLRDEAVGALLDAARGSSARRLFELAREAHRAGLVGVAAQLAVELQRALGASGSETPKDLLRVQYPIDYVTYVNAHANSNGLDPLFLAAVVRQESFWDASAGSSAGALGLTQVIPATGEAIAQALDLPGFTVSDLFKPEVSLRFGAYYLGGQLKRLGDPYYALAAYNAGPANAIRWRDAVGVRGPADFIESIDYSETQHYVAIIIEHYAHYLHAYSD